MLTEKDYFKGAASPQIVENATVLLAKMNAFLEAYGGPITVSSGFRSPSHNKTVGGAKNSKHMSGQAIDLLDRDSALARYCVIKRADLEREGLYCEDPRCTKGWVHFQSVPPKSHQRFFIPSIEWASKVRGPLTLESL